MPFFFAHAADTPQSLFNSASKHTQVTPALQWTLQRVWSFSHFLFFPLREKQLKYDAHRNKEKCRSSTSRIEDFGSIDNFFKNE